MAIALSYTDSIATGDWTTSGSTVEETGVNIGAAASDRLVVVCYGYERQNPVSSVVIGGVTATLYQVESFGSIAGSCVAIANVTSGTTATVTVTMQSSGVVAPRAAVYRVTGANETPHDNATSAPNGAQASTTVDVAANGTVIAAFFERTSSAITWTGVTEDYRDTTNRQVAAASATGLSLETGRTITAGGPTNNACLTVVSLEESAAPSMPSVSSHNADIFLPDVGGDEVYQWTTTGSGGTVTFDQPGTVRVLVVGGGGAGGGEDWFGAGGGGGGEAIDNSSVTVTATTYTVTVGAGGAAASGGSAAQGGDGGDSSFGALVVGTGGGGGGGPGLAGRAGGNGGGAGGGDASVSGGLGDLFDGGDNLSPLDRGAGGGGSSAAGADAGTAAGAGGAGLSSDITGASLFYGGGGGGSSEGWGSAGGAGGAGGGGQGYGNSPAQSYASGSANTGGGGGAGTTPNNGSGAGGSGVVILRFTPAPSVTRVQWAAGEEAGEDPATVTLGAAPTEGNLLIAHVFERSGTSYTALTMDPSWTLRGGEDVLLGDLSERFSYGFFTKTAGASESATITADNGTANAKYIQVIEYNAGTGKTFEFVDIATNVDTNPAATDSLSTGTLTTYSGNDFLAHLHLSVKQESIRDLTAATTPNGEGSIVSGTNGQNHRHHWAIDYELDTNPVLSSTWSHQSPLPHDGVGATILAFRVVDEPAPVWLPPYTDVAKALSGWPDSPLYNPADKGIQVNWSHSITRGLLFAGTPGYQDWVSGAKSKAISEAQSEWTVDPVYGRAKTNSSGSSASEIGHYFDVPETLHKRLAATNNSTLVWLGRGDNWRNNAQFIGLPYDRGTSWDPPYYAIGMYRQGASTNLAFISATSANTFDSSPISNGVILDNQWRMYVVRRNGSLVEYFRDGVYIRNQSNHSTANVFYDTADPPPVTMGNRSPFTPDESLRGPVAVGLIYDRVLQDVEIKELMRNPFVWAEPANDGNDPSVVFTQSGGGGAAYDEQAQASATSAAAATEAYTANHQESAQASATSAATANESYSAPLLYAESAAASASSTATATEAYTVNHQESAQASASSTATATEAYTVNHQESAQASATSAAAATEAYTGNYQESAQASASSAATAAEAYTVNHQESAQASAVSSASANDEPGVDYAESAQTSASSAATAAEAYVLGYSEQAAAAAASAASIIELYGKPFSGQVVLQGGGSAEVVVIFDWTTYALVDSVTPDGSGNWTSQTLAGDQQFGITYLATGHQPVTHGPYTTAD